MGLELERVGGKGGSVGMDEMEWDGFAEYLYLLSLSWHLLYSCLCFHHGTCYILACAFLAIYLSFVSAVERVCVGDSSIGCDSIL